MRILVYGISGTRGGISELLIQIAKYLKKDDIVFDFIIEDNSSIYTDSIKNMKGNTYLLPYHNTVTRIFHSFNLLKKHKNEYDAFYFNASSPYFIFPALFAYFFNYKLITHAHSTKSPHESLFIKLFGLLNRHFLDKHSFLKFQCNDESGNWIFGNKNAIQLNNCIDLKKFNFDLNKRKLIRKKLNLTPDTIVLINVGRLAFPKNQLFLLKLLQKLNTTSSKKYFLFLIGDGDDLAKLQEFSSHNNLSNILFLGDISNVNDYLSSADMFLLPSFYEGFSLSCIEATTNGLPIVVNESIATINDYRIKKISLKSLDEWLQYIDNYHFDLTTRANVSGELKKYDINMVAPQYVHLLNNLIARKELALISIIVPVYNIESYIAKCLTSLLNQSYPNFEIIIVDDGSTDNSSLICQKFAHENSSIHYYKKTNGGLSSAKNYGLKKSQGNLITFVDGDDWVNKEYLNTLYFNMLKSNSDISIISFKKVYDDTSIKVNQSKRSFIFNKNIAIENILYQRRIYTCTWGKLYKKELFNNISFPLNKKCEDLATTYKIFDKCSRISFVPRKLYFYRQRNNSIYSNLYHDSNMDAINFSLEIYDYFLKKDHSLLPAAKSRICDECTLYLRRTNINDKNRQIVKNILMKYNQKILWNPQVKIWLKIKILYYSRI